MSVKSFIINIFAAVFEPIVKRALERIDKKSTNELRRLQEEYAAAVENLPNPLKQYEDKYKIDKLNKTINDIALWRAGREQAKKGKNPRVKPITRSSLDKNARISGAPWINKKS